MPLGLEKTFEVLAATGNEVATEVLIEGLDAKHRSIEEGALRALLRRKNKRGHQEILRRWDGLSARWKSIVAERPSRMANAVRDAVRGNDLRMCQNACDAILRLHEYDLTPVLITALERKNLGNVELVAQTLLTLTESLYEELSTSRDYRNRRDPQLVRQFMLAALEPSISRFAQHHSAEVLEAFLTIANRDSVTLKKLLQNPYDSAFKVVIDLLSTSPRPGIVRLLLNFLDDSQASPAVINILSTRRDISFLRQLLKRINHETHSVAKANLRRIERWSWLSDLTDVMDALNGSEQTALVSLIAWSGLQREEIYEVLRVILRRGNPAGRAEAVNALHEFRGKEVIDDILLALSDPEPQVQANALVQLRDRHIPRAMEKLLEALDSPHAVVRQAVKQSLSEFSFPRYLAAFDKLDDDVRSSTGKLVRKLDAQCEALLRREFQADSRTRRVRAIEMTMAMDMSEPMEGELLPLLEDTDHFIRMSTIEALAQCRTPTTKQALLKLGTNEHVGIRDAAQAALAHFQDVDEKQFPLETEAAP